MQNTKKNDKIPPEKNCEWDFMRRRNYAESSVYKNVQKQQLKNNFDNGRDLNFEQKLTSP